jgi:15-cis-phytoene synthase
MPDSFDHCEALVRAGDKDRYLATLFAPARARRALFALYAFNLEIARVRELAREPMPGEIRLKWWYDIFANPGAAEVRAHPVAAAVSDTIVRYQLPPHVFTDLIEARTFDLYDDPMATVDELDGYCDKTSSALMALATIILDEGTTPGTGSLAGHAGIAYAIAGLLATIAQHAARRQLYVPLDLLRRHGVDLEDIFAGKTTTELRSALAELRLHARGQLGEARALVKRVPTNATAAFLPASLARAMLDRMERRDYDPLRPFEFPQWRRQWRLWRAARRPKRMFG